MNKKKIAIIAYDINPHLGSEPGVAFGWVKILSKNYNLIVYTDGKHKNDLTKNALTNVEYRFISLDTALDRKLRTKKLFNVLSRRFVRKVEKELKFSDDLENIQGIHCLTPAGIFNYNSLYKLGKPVIIGPVGGGLKIPKGFSQYKSKKYLIRNLYYTLLNLNIAWRQYYRKSTLVILGLKETAIHLPPNIGYKCKVVFDTLVDTSYFKPNSEITKNNEIKIVYTGKLEKLKGCNLLLEAFHQCLMETKKDIKLIYIGDGNQKAFIQEYISKYELDQNIFLLDQISLDEVKKQLQEADIFCLPTIRDNGCGAILEAMACGLPIITANYGGPAHSVDDSCGFKVPITNIENFVVDLRKFLLILIENQDLRKQMGENSRSRVENEFSYRSLEEKIIKIYKDVYDEVKN